MGCAGDVQAVKDQILLLKLKRMEVQMEKEKEIKKLSDIEGRPIKMGNIPDYIDPEFAKERNMATDDIDIADDILEKNKKETKEQKKEKNKKKLDKKKEEKNKKDKKDKKKDKNKDKKKDQKSKKKK